MDGLKIGIKDFYLGVTGREKNTYSTEDAVKALERWKVPVTMGKEGTKHFRRVDIGHFKAAKLAFKAETAALKAHGVTLSRRSAANGAPPPPSKELAKVEFKLEVLSSQMSTVEKLLQDLISREARILSAKKQAEKMETDQS